MPEPKTVGAITWDATGRILIDLADNPGGAMPSEVVILRRPKLGELKRFALSFDEVVRLYNDEVSAWQEQQTARSAEIDKATASKREKLTQSLLEDTIAQNDRLADLYRGMLCYWWRDVTDSLAVGDIHLPADVDDWPAELIYAPNVVADTIRHWKFIP
jgi:hypothetical protein